MRKTFSYAKFAFITLTSLSLAGCLSPAKLPAKSTYFINSHPDAIAKQKTRSVTLLVLPPETKPAYNTTQMAYTIKPHEIAYFAKNQWAETPAQMLQPLITRSLQASRAFQAVVSAPYIGRYDYALITNITLLEQNFLYKPATLHLTVRAQLLEVASGRVVGTKEFVIVEPMPTPTPYGGVLAANQATCRLLEELVAFSANRIHR